MAGASVRDVVPLACAWRGTGICIHPKGVTRRADGTIMLGRWAGPSWQAQQAQKFLHEVLTYENSALSCAAPSNETPHGAGQAGGSKPLTGY